MRPAGTTARQHTGLDEVGANCKGGVPPGVVSLLSQDGKKSTSLRNPFVFGRGVFSHLGKKASLTVVDNLYKTPPQAIVDIIATPNPPRLLLNVQRSLGVLLTSHPFSPINDLAKPTLGLAGIRFNEQTGGPAQFHKVDSAVIVDMATNEQKEMKLPHNSFDFNWSPAGDLLYFLVEAEKTIELWVFKPSSFETKKLTSGLNCLLARPYEFSPDGRLLVKLVPQKRDEKPLAEGTPIAPTTQEAKGEAATVRTYQDLLQNEHDVKLFEYYATSQLAFLCPHTKTLSLVRQPDLYTECKISPDLSHILVGKLRKPFSYLVPASRFPATIEVWSRTSETYKIQECPLLDKIPIKGVRQGKRHIHWIPQEDAVLCYVEALDGGDPQNDVAHRDLIGFCTVDGKTTEVTRLTHRYVHHTWIEDSSKMLLTEYDWRKRWMKTHLFDTKTKSITKTLFDRAVHDLYTDPGVEERTKTSNGSYAAKVRQGCLHFKGQGATPEGNRPFLRRLSLDDYSTKELFRSKPPAHEEVIAFIDDEQLVISSESPNESPRYELLSLTNKSTIAITERKDELQAYAACKRVALKYERKDGVELSGVLHLPPDYKEGQRRPALIWAYPRAYSSAKTAGQVRMSPCRYPIHGRRWHNLLALAGYVVLDRAQVPIVGSPETMNDTYVEQVVSSLEAAVNKMDELGYIDNKQVAIGGHSYGAFMVANALAHSKLFYAGVASNGAYNRTLTPFGFQGERRTLWQAQKTYLEMSPFLKADQINSPLLLLHGENDNNEGTFPLQSQRLFHALKGLGKKARLVMLPYESHHFRGQETVLHYLAEMLAWFDKTKGQQ